jgi:hypothetical protein
MIANLFTVLFRHTPPPNAPTIEKHPSPDDFLSCQVCREFRIRHDWRGGWHCKTTHGYTSLCARCYSLLRSWDSYSEESISEVLPGNPLGLANLFYYCNKRRKNKNRKIDASLARRYKSTRRGDARSKLLCAKTLLRLRPDTPIGKHKP